MMAFACVELPYGGDLDDLTIEPNTRGSDLGEALGGIESLQGRYYGLGPADAEAAIARVLTATVLLHNMGAGTLAECIETAITWEVG
jgi:hypothetical protein